MPAPQLARAQTQGRCIACHIVVSHYEAVLILTQYKRTNHLKVRHHGIVNERAPLRTSRETKKRKVELTVSTIVTFLS